MSSTLAAPRAGHSAAPRAYLRRERVVTLASRVWIVREADTSLSPDAPRRQCLLCECALSVRRAWSYPADWICLPDGDLMALFG